MSYFKTHCEQYSLWVRTHAHHQRLSFICSLAFVSCAHQVESQRLCSYQSYFTAMAPCRKNGLSIDLTVTYTQVTQYHSEDEVSDRPAQGDELTFTICSMISDELGRLIIFSCMWKGEVGTPKKAALWGESQELWLLSCPFSKSSSRTQNTSGYWCGPQALQASIQHFNSLFSWWFLIILCISVCLYHRIRCRKRVYTTFMRRIGMGVVLVINCETRTKKITNFHPYWQDNEIHL